MTAFGEWILSADADPGDVPPVYVLICKAEAEDRTPCGVESGPLGSTDAMREWARVHVWNNTGHRSFRLVADVPMVMVPKVEPL
ncbi:MULTISPECIES: hypothetical protein [unclassified Kitasatospora]|uniref:DUF7848 domain-containing protein n=1 Tax=unclassified Kitasatospora TaxID=2633591 RepID=UPI00247724E3|nr:hypothetical protein [Kitasatospora sp. MAP12-44]